MPNTAIRPSPTLAIVGLICAVLGVLLAVPLAPLAMLGLILSIIALRKGQPKGLAVTGIVIGSLGVLQVLIIAAIAIPNLLESRLSSNEAAAAIRLNHELLPAQIMFQAGAYRDDDRNGLGDYGSFTDLAGAQRSLPAAWNGERPELSGYRFRIHVDHDRGFVAYAWPIEPGMGRRQFAVTHRGTVHSRGPLVDATQEPGEYALFGGEKPERYSAEPTADWPAYRR